MKKFLILISLAASFTLFAPLALAAPEPNLSGWAWSETIGWISFNSNNQDAGVQYGVNVDSGGNISGYAWAETIGWISFNENSGCPDAPCKPKPNKSNGEVSGWARAYRAVATEGQTLGGWDGWISLRGTNYGVSVSGCGWSGWAWGSDVVGWIHFQGSGYGVTGSGDACMGGANQPPVADAKISVCPIGTGICVGGPSDSVTVLRGEAIKVKLYADESFDPDKWTLANGVSNGGKCEWNADLEQTSPTFEQTIESPSSSGACNIDLGIRTFNDLPDTYTYQVLKITDNKGAVSNIDTVTVNVIVGDGFSCNSSNQCVFGGGGASCNITNNCVGTPGDTCTSNCGGGGDGGGCADPAACPTATSPSADQLGSDTGFFCPSHQVQLAWNYSDPNGDPQVSFRLQLDDNPSFNSMLIDVYKDTADHLYITPADVLSLGTKYYFRVAVKDSTGKWSNWSATASFTTPTNCVAQPPPPLPHVPECRDGIDNDGDGKFDYVSRNPINPDPGCSSINDDDERNPEFREI